MVAPEQVGSFEAAWRRSPDRAIDALVDELLASPHFGERWGRHWLDVARFAESSGGGRSLMFAEAWRYRDHVIEAFQRDQPFAEFLREQLAGDLLPHDSDDVVALAGYSARCIRLADALHARFAGVAPGLPPLIAASERLGGIRLHVARAEAGIHGWTSLQAPLDLTSPTSSAIRA